MMGLFPESLGGLSLSFSFAVVAGGQKELKKSQTEEDREKSANHFINALHMGRSLQQPQQRQPPWLRHDVADLQLCCARLHSAARQHIIWLNGSTATTMTMTTTKNLLLCSELYKKFGIGKSRHRQSAILRRSNPSHTSKQEKKREFSMTDTERLWYTL